MFGCVTINKPELKVREYERYQGYYCGLCRQLGQDYGLTGRLILNYDMTFLVILLYGLYECPNREERFFCALHPSRRKKALRNEATAYAADMTVLLTYHKLQDDWQDDHNIAALVSGRCFRRRYKKTAARYERQSRAIEQGMQALSEAEHACAADPDTVSGIFGRMLAEVFAWKTDEWTEALRKMGFYMGKFIYLADAYVDLEKDLQDKQFNPLVSLSERADFDAYCEQQLNLIMAECARVFEMLPVLEDAELLRNIMYAGVWTKFYAARNKRMEERAQK